LSRIFRPYIPKNPTHDNFKIARND
jgi:hypothetical protein